MILKYTTFEYNSNAYQFCYSDIDYLGPWCILEIITNNEYHLEKYLNLSSTILDIGANVGLATIILARQNPDAKVLAFEPDKDLCHIIKENIKINNLTNVIVVNKAVCDKTNDQRTLTKCDCISGASTIYANNSFGNFYHSRGATTSSVTVDTISLDDIIKEYAISSVVS